MQSIYPVIGYLTSGGTFLLLALFIVFQKDRSQTQSRILMAATVTMSWGFGHGIVPLLGLPIVIVDVLEIAHVTGWLLVLSGLFAGQQQRETHWRRVLLFALIFTGVGTVSALTVINVLALPAEVGDYFVWLWMLVHVLFAIYGMMMIEAVFRSDDGDTRWKVKHLCFGLAAVFGFDFYLFSDATLFQRVDGTLAQARGYVVALSAILIAVSVSRARVWQTSLQFSRNFATNSVTVLGCGVYLLLMAMAGYYIREFGGSWGFLLQAIFLIATVILLVVVFSSRAIRARIRVFIAKNFFTYRFDYREEWLNFAQALSRDVGQLNLNERIVRAVADIADCTAGSLWVLNVDDRAYLPAAAWNFSGPLSDERLPAEKADSSLVMFLKSSGWIVDLHEYRSEPDRYDSLALPKWLEEHAKANLILPFTHRDELIAFLVIGAPRVPLKLNWELLDLLKTASQQAAGYIAEQVAADALSDARKMEEFNKRSAFVIHDVKNLVGQLSLMAKNAERHGARPEFQKDMLETVNNTIQGMNKLLQQFKQQTATPELPQEPRVEQLNYHRLLQNQASKWRDKTGHLNIKADKAADGIMVVSQDIEVALDHLMLNACEAADSDGEVDLTFEILEAEYLIEVRDNGPGMDPEFIENQLFQPFASSKCDGMGMGAYQVRDLVRNMGGRLEVESMLGMGTAMRIYLPQSESDSPQVGRT